MIVRDPRAEWTYVLKDDRSLPKEQRTTFKLKHLSLADESALIDNFERGANGGFIRRESGSDHLRILRAYLIGWENLRRADGSEVPFEKTSTFLAGAKDELLMLLPLSVREELATAIENEIQVTDEELGKSPSSDAPEVRRLKPAPVS